MSSKSKHSCWNPDCEKTDCKLRTCSRCNSARYCCRECQVAHYKVHRKDCLKHQTKKVQKDDKKASFKAAEAAAIRQSDMADSMAQMIADSAKRMAGKAQNPQQRAAMEKLSKDLSAAVLEEKEKKAAGQYDTSWIHDKEKRSKAVDEMAKGFKEIDQFYASRGTKSPHMQMLERVCDDINNNGGRGVKEMEEKSPLFKQTSVILEYSKMFGGSTPPKPNSMDEIIDKIEPVLGALKGQLQMTQSLRVASISETYSSKLKKLTNDVDEKKTLSASVKASFSPENLASIESKWRTQVGEFLAMTMQGCTLAQMQQTGR